MGTRRKNRLIVVLGPTASGKTDLAVSLCLKLNGEVVSADSRQVYQGMDIGTGKATKKEMKNIKHHLINVASPKRKFTVAQYQRMAHKAISDIIKREKTCFICGGTAFYIKAITQGFKLPSAVPDWKFREQLSRKSTKELYSLLKKKDPQRALTIEKDNPRRLIRALEIVKQTGKPVPSLVKEKKYDFLVIGIKKNQKELEKRIKNRLDARLRKGMINEVKKLKQSGLSWKRIESFGLEYKLIAFYLQKKIIKKEMEENLFRDILKFSRKQMNWWKNDRTIVWVKNEKQALKEVKQFLE